MRRGLLLFQRLAGVFNAASFAANPAINGALVGGAALKSESFLAIAKAFDNTKS